MVTMVDVGAVKPVVSLWGSGPASMLVHVLGTYSELWLNQVEPLHLRQELGISERRACRTIG
jgi:hypothetical protein